MIPQSHARHTITRFEENRSDSSEILSSFFKAIDLPTSTMSHGYGMDLSLQTDGWTLKTNPFCWCDNSRCPYCNSSFDTEDLGLSAHDLIEGKLAKEWEDKGFVEGHGAPNFWLFHEDGREVQIWWYKYIGRSMEWAHSPTMTWEVLETLLKNLAPRFAEVAKHSLLVDALHYQSEQKLATKDLAAMPVSVLSTLHDMLNTSAKTAQDYRRVQDILSQHTTLPTKGKDDTADPSC